MVPIEVVTSAERMPPTRQLTRFDLDNQILVGDSQTHLEGRGQIQGILEI